LSSAIRTTLQNRQHNLHKAFVAQHMQSIPLFAALSPVTDYSVSLFALSDSFTPTAVAE